MTPPTATAPRAVDDLRGEYLAHGYSGWIWEWLLDLLVAYVRFRLRGRYRAALYSPSGEWDDTGTRDLVNEFVTKRVFEKEVLSKALAQADTTAGVVRYLETAFHRYTIKERGQSLARNIYERLRVALRDDPGLHPVLGIGARAAYGPAEWIVDPPAVADADTLRGAERFLPVDLEITEYRVGTRRSPILERKELLRAAHALIRGVCRPLSARQILTVIGRRFDLEDTHEVDVPEETLGGVRSVSLDPLEQLVAEESAERLLDALNARQRAVLRFLVEAPAAGCREVAERLGCSKSTVHNERIAISAAAARLGLVEQWEQAQALHIAVQMLEVAEVDVQ